MISVQNISKEFLIDSFSGSYKTFREELYNLLKLIVSPSKFRKKVKKEKFQALDDISFDVYKGDRFAVIGGNGAGKSTLLKVLSKITSPSEGKIFLNGKTVTLLEVGTGFHPELTGRENIFLNGAILGMSRSEIKNKLHEIVKFAEVEKFLDIPVKRYSSGMYVRLAFAVAAHLEPDILIVDEVLAVGDIEFQKKCIGKMNEVSKSGRTIIFVSHDMGAVKSLCNRGIILNKGIKYFESDEINVLVEKYHSIGCEENDLHPIIWKKDNNVVIDESFDLSHAFLCDENNIPLSSANINGGSVLGVIIAFETKSLNPALEVGIRVYNATNDLLFVSQFTDYQPSDWPKIKIGLNKLHVAIPINDFNLGLYRVEVVASIHKRHWLLEPGCHDVNLYFQKTGLISMSPYWLANRGGAYAPLLKWSQID